MCVYDDLGWDWGLRKVDAKTVDVRKMSLLREVRIRPTRGARSHRHDQITLPHVRDRPVRGPGHHPVRVAV